MPDRPSSRSPSGVPKVVQPQAPHVRASLARAAQAKLAPRPSPAPHVQAASTLHARPASGPAVVPRAAQEKVAVQPSMAPHVQAAGKTVQTLQAKPAAGAAASAPHVRAALAAAVQTRSHPQPPARSASPQVQRSVPLPPPRSPVKPVLQCAVPSKADLEEAFLAAMEMGDDKAADEIDAQMRQMPGDSAQTFGTSEEDAYDLTYRGKQLRFGWPKGLRAALTVKQTASGKLYCALGVNCYVYKASGSHEIAVDSNGKEVWVSKGSGKTHYTAPPIDHYSPDWKDRLAAVEKKGYDIATFAAKAYEQYIADPLRIIHMHCNSKRNGE